MERTLTDKLKGIEEGYQAARVREQLMTTHVIATRADFRRILDAEYPPEDHTRLTQQALHEGPAFTEGWNKQGTLEDLKGWKEEEVLHTEAAVLWAVDMVEKKLLPSYPRLAAHVIWVAEFFSPQ